MRLVKTRSLKLILEIEPDGFMPLFTFKFAFSLLNPEATKYDDHRHFRGDHFFNILINHVNLAVPLSAHFTDKECNRRY